MAANQIEIEVYHGTLDSKANIILKSRRFIESNKTIEWLGKGVYFFHLKKDADFWAKQETKNKLSQCSKAAVLSAVLKTESEKFLDLDNPDVATRVDGELIVIEDELKQHRVGNIKFKGKHRDHFLLCYYINVYCELNPDITLVAFSFPKEGENKCNWFGLPIKRRQYCVKNQDIIIELKKEVQNYAI